MESINEHKMEKTILLTAFGAISLFCFIAIVQIGDLREHLALYFIFSTIPFCIMLLAFRKWKFLVPGKERTAMWIVIACAIASRISLLGLAPSLSDDLYRYIWDGRMIAHGYNPYRYSPADTTLSQFHDDVYEHVAYKDYYSIYPPLTEMGLGASAVLSKIFFGDTAHATAAVWKFILLAAETGTMLLLMRLLLFFGKSGKYLLLYAWHPLPIMEFAGQGHGDALMIFFLLAAITATVNKNAHLAIVGFAASIAARGTPIVFAPVLSRSIKIKGIAAALGIALCTFVPFYSISALRGIFFSTSRMAQYFTFNSFGYWIIRSTFEQLKAWDYEPYIPLLLGIIFLAGIIILYRRSHGHGTSELPKDILNICTLFVLVLWNMHPWYFTWGLAMIPLATSWAWVWITFAANFTYIHYTPHSDDVLLTIEIMEYGVFILILFWQRMNERDRHLHAINNSRNNQ